MKNNILKLILFIPFIIYCSDNKNITGDEFPFIGVGDWVFSKTLYPAKSENIRIEKYFGSKDMLLLGEFNEYSSNILIKFRTRGDFKSIKSANMVLTPHSSVGEVSSEFEGLIYEITSDWNEYEIPEISYNSNEVVSFSVYSTSDKRDSITVPPDLVQKWYNDTTTNYGIMIGFKNADFIKKYFSKEGVGFPYMLIKGNIGTTEDTVYIYPEMDTHLVKSKVEPNLGELTIDDLSIYRSIIKFDSISIPENSTINMALLELVLKTEDSFIQGEYEDRLYAYRVETSSWKPDEIEFEWDSFENQQASNFIDDNTVQINITGIFQQWVSNIKENNGLIIKSKSYNEGAYPGKYVFNLDTLSQIEPSKLLIKYSTIKTEHQF